MASERVGDQTRLLANSENRAAVLETVCKEGPIERTVIEVRIDATRRTVKRALENLEQYNYVRSDSETYEPTALGAHVLESYRAYQENLRLTEELEPVLSRLPADAIDFDLDTLSDAQVRTADDGSPYRLLERVLELRGEASRIRELSSVVEERSIRQLRNRVQDAEDLDVEFVLSQEAGTQVESIDSYEAIHCEVLSADGVTGYVADAGFPFVLGIFDDVVVIGVDEDGLPEAMLESTDQAVYQWAEECFKDYRSRATRIDLQ